MTTIEIEDMNGNTIMTFNIDKKLHIEDIKKFNDCGIADEDNDYIFTDNTGNRAKDNLIRIQSDKHSIY